MKRLTCQILLAACVLSAAAPMVTAEEAASPDPYANETPAQRDARMAWWRDAKFGMFIHWGVYAVPAGTYEGTRIGGTGEWIMHQGRILCARYQQYAGQFNPVKYDPDAWVRLAKEAGMKYIVITSKHHDGFALFDSAATDWDVASATPYKKDLLAPLAEACRKHGLKLGFYYSQAQDWNHKGGAGNGWDPGQQGSMDDYIKQIAVPQVREILTKYGEDTPAVLWWDTPFGMNRQRAEPLIELLKLKPGIIHNNRLGGGFAGATETPEQSIPATGYGDRDWETCMTMNDTWGFKSYDNSWKSAESLIRMLIDIASKGGNYLLNVGPTAEGEIPQPSIDRLKQVGRWMKVNGEAIYGTRANPVGAVPWGRITAKISQQTTRLYLHVFDWPQNAELLVPGLRNEVVAARLLDGGQKLDAQSGEAGVTVKLPSEASDPIASVVVLEVRGKPVVVKPAIRQAEDGSLTLTALSADLRGPSNVSPPQLEGSGENVNIGYWLDPRPRAEWIVEVKQPGEFEVSATVAATGDGARVTVSAGDAALQAAIPNTGDYGKYTTVKLGRLNIRQPGRQVVTVQPQAEGWTPINLRRLVLKPADVQRDARQSPTKSYDLASPNGNIKATVTFNETAGTLTFRVTSGGAAILAESPLGIMTDKARFTDGLKLLHTAEAKIDETYTLPQGKVSTYHNQANEMTLALEKDGRKLNVIFRAYDDGIAFRYAIPGTGDIQITEEATAFHVAGAPAYWGQSHPNAYGYEFPLGRIDHEAYSLALLCELKESKHWVLLAQAATYGDYCIPYLTRADRKSNLLKFTFPLDQKEPIQTTLPFASPWRAAVISPNDLSRIVEQTLFENLNPPTEPELVHADWIQPGRSSWDYLAGDKANWKGWIDFDAEMGWEYHLVDAGWRGYVKDPPAATAYARSKGRGLFAWEFTPKLQEEEAIENLFKQYAEIGLRGSKIDFFDRLPGGKDTTADSEDTQLGLQVRDRICRLGAKYKIQLVFHGCAIPSGERRRWPHLLGTEAVHGQESGPGAQHDNCIAYIRNPLGPVDWSPTLFGKGGKTDAYQLATSVVFESGLLIFADLHKDYLAHPSKQFLMKVPAAWDETKLVDGYPGSHTVIARRKGKAWYVGGLTTQGRNVDIAFGFLEKGTTYTATIFKDKMAGLELTVETKEISSSNTIQFATADRGGFVVHLEPKK